LANATIDYFYATKSVLIELTIFSVDIDEPRKSRLHFYAMVGPQPTTTAD